METIFVELIYPTEFEKENKVLELTQLELNALMGSNKIGSEGKYFIIDEIIFEDLGESEDHSVTVLLEYNK